LKALFNFDFKNGDQGTEKIRNKKELWSAYLFDRKQKCKRCILEKHFPANLDRAPQILFLGY